MELRCELFIYAWGRSQRDEVMALEQGLDPTRTPQARGKPQGNFPALYDMPGIGGWPSEFP